MIPDASGHRLGGLLKHYRQFLYTRLLQRVNVVLNRGADALADADSL